MTPEVVNFIMLVGLAALAVLLYKRNTNMIPKEQVLEIVKDSQEQLVQAMKEWAAKSVDTKIDDIAVEIFDKITDEMIDKAQG